MVKYLDGVTCMRCELQLVSWFSFPISRVLGTLYVVIGNGTKGT